MTRTATVETKLTLKAAVKNTLDDGSIASGNHAIDFLSGALGDGVSSGQANRAWAKKSISISSGGTLVIDLYDFAAQDIGAGAGNDIVGQAIVMEEVTTVAIQNASTSASAGQLEVEPDSTNGWTPIGTHTVATGGALGNGGVILKHSPDEAAFNVTDASSHRILLTANGGDVSVNVFIAGRHDDNESSSSSSNSSSSSSTSTQSSSSSSSSVSSSSSSSLSSLSSSSSSSTS